METAPEMREFSAASSRFPGLEGVIDGMVSHERDPDDCADLEREWANVYEASLAAAKAGDRENLTHLVHFADYHTNLLSTLGLNDTALAAFLAGEREKLHTAHAEFSEA